MKNDSIKCFLLICCVRLSVLLLIRTSYVPDEYYQFQEPALNGALGTDTSLNLKVLNQSDVIRFQKSLGVVSRYQNTQLCSAFALVS